MRDVRMPPLIRYIELKPSEHTDSATAWIARVWPSASGKTLYFNNMALKRHTGTDCNHCDLVTHRNFWVSGVKKRGTNRHPSGGGPVYTEQSLVEWYKRYTQSPETCGLIPIPDIPKPDIRAFNAIENQPMG